MNLGPCASLVFLGTQAQLEDDECVPNGATFEWHFVVFFVRSFIVFLGCFEFSRVSVSTVLLERLILFSRSSANSLWRSILRYLPMNDSKITTSGNIKKYKTKHTPNNIDILKLNDQIKSDKDV